MRHANKTEYATESGREMRLTKPYSFISSRITRVIFFAFNLAKRERGVAAHILKARVKAKLVRASHPRGAPCEGEAT
jgi:hypothetical protein